MRESIKCDKDSPFYKQIFSGIIKIPDCPLLQKIYIQVNTGTSKPHCLVPALQTNALLEPIYL